MGMEAVERNVAAGFPVTTGELCLAPSTEVLEWIAGHVTSDMRTIETGAGYTTVLFAALAKHHYCCTMIADEIQRIRAYMQQIGIPLDKVTFLEGSSDVVLPQLQLQSGLRVDFAFIDGCHGYPFPSLDWHYIDKILNIGGVIGMDNAELRAVREHCEFLDENGSYRRIETLSKGAYYVRFYEKLTDELREWVDQKYSRAQRGWVDRRLSARVLDYLRRRLTAG